MNVLMMQDAMRKAGDVVSVREARRFMLSASAAAPTSARSVRGKGGAQWVAHRALNAGVVGSIPTLGAEGGLAMEDADPLKVERSGSSPGRAERRSHGGSHS